MNELKAFYKAYADWLRAGAPKNSREHNPFSFCRDTGLCYNRHRYCLVTNDSEYEMTKTMFDQFRRAGLDPLTPFYKKDSANSYLKESNNNACHLNEQRRKWVFDHE